MSAARRCWAGLRLALLAGSCGVALAFGLIGALVLAHGWAAQEMGAAHPPTAAAPQPAQPQGGSRT